MYAQQQSLSSSLQLGLKPPPTDCDQKQESKVDPMTPQYGPLILNPYIAIITPPQTTSKEGPIVQSPLKKVRAHTKMLRKNGS